MSHLAAAAAILKRWEAGAKFFPWPICPRNGAEWPPGWHPAPWQPAYKMTPAQTVALALAKAGANAAQHRAGPLSKKHSPYFNPD